LRRIAAQPLAGELVEILLPFAVAVAPELGEIVPAVDASGVHVVKHEPHRVIADWMHLQDRDLPLAGLGLALIG
jgi:hypothetical protein